MGGNKIETITPDKLNIVWNGDDRYWRTEKDGVARLLQVCWLEVTGTSNVNMNKRYKVSFTVSLTPDAFGWSNYPVCIMARACLNKPYIVRRVKLSNSTANEKPFVIPGDLIVDTYDQNKISFGLYEVWSGMWKGGLKIHNACVEEISALSSDRSGMTT